MTVWDAIILGIVQGLTEFLPISSSGHLVISEHLLGVTMPGISFEVWLHFGTLIAVLVYFFKRIVLLLTALIPGGGEDATYRRTTVWAIVVGTVPAVVVGLLLKSTIEEAFSSPVFASSMLLVTGAFLLLSVLAKNKQLGVTIPKGLYIGLAQAFAILPGISRSGSTITMAMFLGMKPSEAAEFSFLLAIPAVGGAFLLDMLSAGGELFTGDAFMLYIVGTMVSFVFGLLSIHYLLKIVKKGSFYFFGFYCLAAGIVSLIYVS
ncbi:MAG: undecaprenyl-diphosphatase UppP [Candidatus Zixiibacteriota bacterium]